MSRENYLLKNVKNCPETLKRAVANEARAREVTMNDVVGEILAKHYKEEFEPSGEKMRKEPAGSQFFMRLPPVIVALVWAEAKRRGMTESSVILAAIADHYGLLYNPVRRKGAIHKKKAKKEEATS